MMNLLTRWNMWMVLQCGVISAQHSDEWQLGLPTHSSAAGVTHQALLHEVSRAP